MCVWGGGVAAEGVWEISVSSVPFFCELKTALKKPKSIQKNPYPQARVEGGPRNPFQLA